MSRHSNFRFQEMVYPCWKTTFCMFDHFLKKHFCMSYPSSKKWKFGMSDHSSWESVFSWKSNGPSLWNRVFGPTPFLSARLTRFPVPAQTRFPVPAQTRFQLPAQQHFPFLAAKKSVFLGGLVFLGVIAFLSFNLTFQACWAHLSLSKLSVNLSNTYVTFVFRKK